MVLASLEVPLDAVTAAARAAREVGAGFALNPAPARLLPDDLLAFCDVLVPNEVELTQLRMPPGRLFTLGVGAVVVTWGGEGAELLRPGHPPSRVPALRVTVRDTTGAGDAFVAAFCAARTLGLDLHTACRFAAAAGSLSTTAAGAQGHLPSRAEIERSMADLREQDEPQTPEKQLAGR